MDVQPISLCYPSRPKGMFRDPAQLVLKVLTAAAVVCIIYVQRQTNVGVIKWTMTLKVVVKEHLAYPTEPGSDVA